MIARLSLVEIQPFALSHEGTSLLGELYVPSGPGPHPAVLVMHSGLGMQAHEREVAAKLQALGYAALVADMYGEGKHDAIKDAGSAYQAMQDDRDLLRRRVVHWFETLAVMPQINPNRIAILGYCFGGQCALELARSGADVKAVISFHGVLHTLAPAQIGAIKGEVVAWCAGQDPYAPSGDIAALQHEMALAEASFQLTIFEKAEHGFTDKLSDTLGRPGISYNALADTVSWAGTVALLETALK